MSKLVIVFFVALAGALVACSSGDDAGPPAGLPFDPLGTESPSGTGASGGNDPPPPPPETSIESLCNTVCARFRAACSGETCDASSCASIAAYAGNCQAELRAYLACLARAPIECGPYGPDIGTCQGSADVFTNCTSGTYAELK
jgi:hypothetical protein